MNWRRWVGRGRKDRDRADEIAAHLDHARQHLQARGLSPEAARRAARIRFGNPRAHREELTDLARLPVVDVLLRDVRYAVRMIARAPVFSMTVIATLALVIGATTAVFSLAHAILLRPLPYPNSDRLAIVRPFVKSATDAYTNDDVDGAMWETVRDRATTLDAAVAADDPVGVNFVLDNSPSFVENQRVGAGYFRVLGVAPFLGREFTQDEDQPGGPVVAVLGFDFWRRRLGSRPDILGRSILLRGEPFVVIGVMPASFRPPGAEVDVWTPLRLSTRTGGQGTNWTLIARLRPGRSFADADRELRSFGKTPFRLITPYQRAETFATLTIAPMQRVLPARVGARDPILTLSWAVGLVLLIACVNIAALLLARGADRAKELAIRIALGSGRGAVVRQLMVESVLLAMVGGAFGLLVSALGLAWLPAAGGSAFSRWKDVTLDGPAVALMMGLSLLTSVVFGLVPALQASRLNVQAALADGGSRSIAGGGRHGLQRALVVAEVALGAVMLVAAGLLLRQFAYLQSLDPGFRPDHLYSARVSLADARYRDPATIARLFDGSLGALGRQGLTEAAVSWGLPYQRLVNLPVDLEGRPKRDGDPSIASVTYVTPGFFETLGIRLERGRAFDDRDRVDAAPVVVVNAMFARLFFPDQPAIGRRLVVANAVREVVGVSRDVQQFAPGFWLPGMTEGPVHTAPTIYITASQAGADLLPGSSPVWTVRAPSAVQAAAAIAAALGEFDPLLPVSALQSMTDVMAKATAPQRLLTTLVGVLAGAAILLAAIGLHGLLAQAVAERTREFGLRLALGASPWRIVRTVANAGVALAAVGALVGGLLSVPAVHLIESALFTVGAHDPATYAGAAVLLVAVAALSSVLPTLRILRLDPAKTLRD